MRVLITGGAGFIGSHLVRHFQGRAEIIVMDNLRTGCRKNLDGLQHTFIHASITDRGQIKAAVRGIDVIFHLAAMISVPESMRNIRECVDINVTGLLNVLEEASAAGVRKIVFASSAAVYGDNPIVPKSESMLPEPKSPYAITKLDGEYYLEMFRRQRGLDAVSLRFFNVFGPGQDPRGAYAAAVPVFLRNALAGAPLTIFGDGEQTRDFVYVKDIVAALAHVAVRPDLNGIFNVGYGKSMTINNLARQIIRLAGSSSEIHYLPGRPGDVKHSLASVEKLLSTGYCHDGTIERGLAETIAAMDK